jgi:hypothetical protein
MTFVRQSRTSPQLFQEIRPKSKCGHLAGRKGNLIHDAF